MRLGVAVLGGCESALLLTLGWLHLCNIDPLRWAQRSVRLVVGKMASSDTAVYVFYSRRLAIFVGHPPPIAIKQALCRKPDKDDRICRSSSSLLFVSAAAFFSTRFDSGIELSTPRPGFVLGARFIMWRQAIAAWVSVPLDRGRRNATLVKMSRRECWPL